MSRSINYDKSASVTDAVSSRRSLRAFLPKQVDRETISDLLLTASRAPSSTNMQPWNTYVLMGSSLSRVCAATCEAFDDIETTHNSEIRYYPEKWFDPYLTRRRQVGWALYDLLGITKGDRERTRAQHRRNFLFFDAPVGLIFSIHRDLSTGSWLDYGMFLQNVMLLAREQGLHTCPQAAWADYHEVLRGQLPIAEHEMVVCGMAMGFADPDAVENSLVSERVDSSENVLFLT
ncbi:MAG: nitroreductase [Granulosicoccus sp.]